MQMQQWKYQRRLCLMHIYILVEEKCHKQVNKQGDNSLSCVWLFATLARIPEWVAFPFSRGSSQPRDWTQVSHIVGGFFTSWATGKPFHY